MIKINKKGFTLVELLAVIVVLGIVASISIYAITNTIRKTKEKSYQVTINEIENMANDYLLENNGKLFFISSNDGSETEYQCVTIKQLIDAGYFKTDITESLVDVDTNVNINDFVKITRNQNSKVISDIAYIKNDDSNDLDKCRSAFNSNANIRFEIEPNEWSKEKTVKISYTLISNTDSEDYVYGYSYDDTDYFDNSPNKEFLIDKNVLIKAYIKNGNNVVKNSSYLVKSIDNTKPTINYSLNAGEYNTKKDVKITTIDNESGFDHMNIKVYKDDALVTDESNLSGSTHTINLDSSGEWRIYTEAFDKLGNKNTKEANYSIITKITENDFNYTGQLQFISEDDNNWYVKFLSSGTLTLSKSMEVEVFLVGGGGGGGGGYYDGYAGTYGGGGGGGGYIATGTVTISSDTNYEILVGTGGAANTNGGDTTAFGLTANGGNKANSKNGGAGTGAGGTGINDNRLPGASNKKANPGGNGQAAFGNTSYYYGAGGGAGAGASKDNAFGEGGSGGANGGGAGGGPWGGVGGDGVANSGGGGGGGGAISGKSGTASGGNGGSGIVIIRNVR